MTSIQCELDFCKRRNGKKKKNNNEKPVAFVLHNLINCYEIEKNYQFRSRTIASSAFGERTRLFFSLLCPAERFSRINYRPYRETSLMRNGCAGRNVHSLTCHWNGIGFFALPLHKRLPSRQSNNRTVNREEMCLRFTICRNRKRKNAIILIA